MRQDLQAERHKTSGFFHVLIATLLLSPAFPPVHAWSSAPLLEEKRSCIQMVDGYAYLAEKLTLADMRKTAIANAKEQALSNAKTYISSKTEVENFTLKTDLVQMQAEGSVVVLELKDLGIEDNSRYHVKMKAEVFYEMATPQAKTATKPPPADGPLTVHVWAGQTRYRTGEKITIQLQGNRDFFARIVNISPNGNIIQLLPNSHRASTSFHGGTIYSIPDQGDTFDLTVSPPFGKETIVVYASLVELGPVKLQGTRGGLATFSGDQGSLAMATRGITVTPVASSGSKAAVIDFYEARLILDSQQ